MPKLLALVIQLRQDIIARMDAMLLRPDCLTEADVIVTTPQEIAERGDVIGHVLRPALAEGIVIYEQQ